MKFFLLIIISSTIISFSYGQTKMGEIVNVDSTLTKAVLFSNGLSWFAYQFKSSNDVIQMKDLESGKIIGKGIFENVIQNGKSIPRHILITLIVKDGRYKYDMELEIVREFQIVLEASCFNCGKTSATVTYTNGFLQINNISTGKGFYQYDKEIVSGIEHGNYNKWKAKVDLELPELMKKIENEIKVEESLQIEVDKQKLQPFIDSLKSEMINSNSEF